MGKVIVIGSVISCIFLLFALACAVVAQASHSWWIVKSASDANDYYFGLYRFCWDVNGKEKCYKFDPTELKMFMNDTIGEDAADKLKILESETVESKNLWIMSFFFTVLCGICAILSTFALFQAFVGKAIFITICIQSFLTFCALVIGVVTAVYAAEMRKDIWPSGVTFLQTYGHATGKIGLDGLGYIFQMISVISVAIPYASYLILLVPSKKLRKQKLQMK